MVGSRDCTKLVAGVNRQVGLVRAALDQLEIGDVPITGMLCFIDADWPLIGGSFRIDGIHVLWPKLAVNRICDEAVLSGDAVQSIHRGLASAFPSA